MSDTIISVENLSKKYVLGGNGGRSEGLRHAIQEMATVPLRLMKNISQKSKVRSQNPISDLRPPTSDLRPPTSEDFWALRDVSFEVKRGEVVGIIGRNGAGKSTLLKILSRITEPTEGRVTLRGRVASLLEVGTGFHPELTGRENVFLNGAILGMSRAEIRKKFDEIVDFSGVEQFIDTPVKRYSSGMYVRLAFAVAAHLEPEILIVDEVLAVGDAEFQKKCLGKMQDVSAKEGRTVLFVSHNLAAVRQLCVKGVLLENGEMAMDDTANAVADRYLQTMADTKREQSRMQETGYTMVRLVSLDGTPVSSVLPAQKAFVELGLRINEGSNVHCGITIFNQMDVPLVLCASEYGGVTLKNGEQSFRVRLPNELLQPGTYRIEGAVWDANHVYHKDDCLCIFQVMPVLSHELLGRKSPAQFVTRESWIAVADVHLSQTLKPANFDSESTESNPHPVN